MRTSAAELSKASPRWSVEVVAYLVLGQVQEYTVNASALVSGSAVFFLLCAVDSIRPPESECPHMRTCATHCVHVDAMPRLKTVLRARSPGAPPLLNGGAKEVATPNQLRSRVTSA